MKRLGIIADTHNRLPSSILELFNGVDHILHAGDVCEERILDELRAIAPVTVVSGNNDYLPHYKTVERREFNGIRYYLTHILPRHPPKDTDWIIFGHTHVPYNETVNGLHFFNPGSAGKANKGAPASVALLDWENGQWDSRLVILK